MISIEPAFDVQLEHGAYFLAVAGSGHIAAIDANGQGSLLDPSTAACSRFQLCDQSMGLALSTQGELIAACNEKELRVIRATGEQVGRASGSTQGVAFSRGDSLLWSGLVASTTSVRVVVRDVPTFRVVSEVEVPDPFGHSVWMLLNRPADDSVVLCGVWPHGGRVLFHLSLDGAVVRVAQVPGFDGLMPPAFDATGGRFLDAGNDRVRQREFPGGAVLGEMRWRPDTDWVGDFTCYATPDHAVMASGQGRLHLLRLRDMQLIDELVVRGHEPRLASTLFEQPTKPDGLCGDAHWMQSHPAGGLVSAHHELGRSIRDPKRDRVLWWHPPAELDPPKQESGIRIGNT